MRSARPAHAVVSLSEGAGLEPSVLAKALKTLQKKLGESGAAALISRRESRLYVA
jgi:hypothetical protein